MLRGLSKRADLPLPSLVSRRVHTHLHQQRLLPRLLRQEVHTRNEVIVSRARDKEYHLYRVFNFSRARQLYTVRGALPETCVLEPTAYRAVPR